jgi:hypothetical protein
MSLVGLKIASSNLALIVSARYIKHESKSVPEIRSRCIREREFCAPTGRKKGNWKDSQGAPQAFDDSPNVT